jgi:hypothetical protein
MKITNNSYTFVENATEQDSWHVKIKEGDYAGIIYQYGRIQVKEDFDTESAKLQFQFNIKKIPDELGMESEDLLEDETFMNLLGDILTHIIEDAMDNGNYKIGNNDKSTDSESTVHE